MKTLAVRLVLALMMLSLIFSCKAYRNVENLKPKTSEEMKAGPFDNNELKKLVPGDRITVSSTTGFKYYMVYQNYTSDKLVGSAWKVNQEKLEIPQKTEIPIEDIDQIRVRRVSAAATAPFVALGAMGIWAAIVAIIWSSGGGFAM